MRHRPHIRASWLASSSYHSMVRFRGCTRMLYPSMQSHTTTVRRPRQQQLPRPSSCRWASSTTTHTKPKTTNTDTRFYRMLLRQVHELEQRQPTPTAAGMDTFILLQSSIAKGPLTTVGEWRSLTSMHVQPQIDNPALILQVFGRWQQQEQESQSQNDNDDSSQSPQDVQEQDCWRQWHAWLDQIVRANSNSSSNDQDDTDDSKASDIPDSIWTTPACLRQAIALAFRGPPAQEQPQQQEQQQSSFSSSSPSVPQSSSSCPMTSSTKIHVSLVAYHTLQDLVQRQARTSISYRVEWEEEDSDKTTTTPHSSALLPPPPTIRVTALSECIARGMQFSPQRQTLTPMYKFLYRIRLEHVVIRGVDDAYETHHPNQTPPPVTEPEECPTLDDDTTSRTTPPPIPGSAKDTTIESSAPHSSSSSILYPAVQLLGRAWFIQEQEETENGSSSLSSSGSNRLPPPRIEIVQPVTGAVGQQPVLQPGQGFEYISGCDLTRPTGHQEGWFSWAVVPATTPSAQLGQYVAALDPKHYMAQAQPGQEPGQQQPEENHHNTNESKEEEKKPELVESSSSSSQDYYYYRRFKVHVAPFVLQDPNPNPIPWDDNDVDEDEED